MKHETIQTIILVAILIAMIIVIGILINIYLGMGTSDISKLPLQTNMHNSFSVLINR